VASYHVPSDPPSASVSEIEISNPGQARETGFNTAVSASTAAQNALGPFKIYQCPTEKPPAVRNPTSQRDFVLNRAICWIFLCPPGTAVRRDPGSSAAAT